MKLNYKRKGKIVKQKPPEIPAADSLY